MRLIAIICLCVLVGGVVAMLPAAASASAGNNDDLESRIQDLERDVGGMASKGVVLILFGAFCALWAQNTGRKPWLWFIMGFIFSVITVIVLLSKNAKDLSSGSGFNLNEFRKQ